MLAEKALGKETSSFGDLELEKSSRFTALLLSIGALALSLSPRPAVGQSLQTLIDSGPSANRVDLVFFGDGYTQSDLDAGQYATHIDSYLQYLFSDNLLTDPFHRYRNYFNVHAINVVSNQSGADDPSNGVYVDTALDASYAWNGGAERILYTDTTKANAIRDEVLADTDITADIRMVTVNSAKYGGGGGAMAVFAGGNPSANDLALHEMGHAFARLADEYDVGGPTVYASHEPFEPNVTTDPTGAKWSQWIGYDQPGIGTIDVYEGGRYSEQGIYRPSLDSKMRTLDQPFNAVSREEIILRIYDQVDPLDSWTSNDTPITNPEKLFVRRLDPQTIDIQWFVDDALIATESESLNLVGLGYGAGEYNVTARAYDPTGFDPVEGWVRRDRDKLEQFIDWTVVITEQAPLMMGDLNTDGQVNSDDIAPFVQALTDRAVYVQAFPEVDPDVLGDFNGDGLLTNGDISGFIASLNTSGIVPVPASLALLSVGCLAITRRRVR